MLKSYYPIYEIALELQGLRSHARLLKGTSGYRSTIDRSASDTYRELIQAIQKECLEHGLIPTSEMAERLIHKAPPTHYDDLYTHLEHLEESLGNDLKKEAVFRIRPELKTFYEQDHLFGGMVSVAFPSCERDIRKAGSCYALEQEDACVHHVMLVLERGLNALATKVQVPYQRINWQVIIDQIGARLKSAPRGQERDFLVEINGQFGFLKDVYRNHSEHARDNYSDMPKALSILNHVRSFMQELAKGGLSE